MNTKNRLLIDQIILGFVIKVMNILVITLGKILKIDHNLDKNFDHIAICKFKGMGSIIQSTPLIRSLKQKFPNSKITYISTQANAQILQEYPQIDAVILLDDSSIFSLVKSFIPFIFQLNRSKFQVYIDLEVYSNFSTLCSILSASTNRLGYYLKSKDFRKRNYTHMMYFNRNCEIGQTYLQWARLLNCNELNTELLLLKSTNRNTDLLSKYNLTNQKYIVINPNASDLRIERRWNIESFIHICETISNQLSEYKIVLIGSKNEVKYINRFVNHFKNHSNIISLAGKTSISELVEILKNSKFLLTNDTGPMHLAFASKVKTVALFGPCSPIQYGINSNCYPIYTNMYCSPCIHEFALPPCKGDNICMSSISEKIVFNTIKMVISGRENTKFIGQKQYSSNNQISGLVRRS